MVHGASRFTRCMANTYPYRRNAKSVRFCERFQESGDDRNRTCDILLAKQALYQLSYVPVVEARRLELLTLTLPA